MNVERHQAVVIGGGPAGLAAAIQLKQKGIDDVVVLEREHRTGGILRQCIHDGFGLTRFGETLSGPEYAQRFVDQAEELGITCLTDTTVLSLEADRTVTASGHAGIYTAGVAQEYINLCNLMVGREVVILGSGDIGLIMARRMTLEGAHVKGVYEVQPYPRGLPRNIEQCLNDYNIPLHLSHTVTDIHGREQLEGMTISQVDERFRPIPGTEEQLPIDVVVDGELYAQYFEPESLGGVICLPSFTAGQHVTMVLGIADDEIFHTNTQIYQLDSAALAAARQQVQDVDADIREGGRIDVHCTVSGDNDLLALSFAYDDNWVVTVNGEEVQPSALFGGLLGVSLPQGDCTVTLRYTHPGVVPGAAASLAALAAALVWWFAERRRSQNA